MPTSSPVRKIGIALLLVLAAGILWYGGTQKASSPDPKLLDAAVVSLAPPEDSPGVPRQEPIVVELQPSWTGVLQVNGIEIPEDETQRDPARPNVFSFQAGPGKVIESLPPGDVTATAVIWPILESRETASRQFSWTFRVA
ncbi:MAG TPA: hypothetical protein VGH94_13195 [Acidimicrobiales bacterium]